MSRLIRGAFALLLAATVLQHVGVPEGFGSYWLNVAYVLIGLAVFLYWGYRREFGSVRTFVAHGFVATALLGLVLTLIATREEFLLDHHALKIAIIYLLFLGYPLAQHDPVEFLREAGVYYLAFAALVGSYFVHIFVGPGAYPIVMGLIVGANLFVVPRYVDRASFLDVVGWISGVVAALGLAAYAVGEYGVLSLRVTFWKGTFTPAFSETTLPVLQSVFLNPNTTGVLLFAGTIASLVRSVEYSARRSPRAVFPVLLLLLNGRRSTAPGAERARWRPTSRPRSTSRTSRSDGARFRTRSSRWSRSPAGSSRRSPSASSTSVPAGGSCSGGGA